jgi:hypothetical protein
MRAEKMTKEEFAEWLAILDKALTGLGMRRFVYDKAEDFRDEVPGYEIETIGGTLVCHPEIPIRNKHLSTEKNCTVYGRFRDGDFRKVAGANPYSGKWNFHFGKLTGDSIALAAATVCHEIRRILPPKAAPACRERRRAPMAALVAVALMVASLTGCVDNPGFYGAGSMPSRQLQAPAPISYIVQPGGGGGNLAGPPDGQLFALAGWANMAMPYVGAIAGAKSMQWFTPGLYFPR